MALGPLKGMVFQIPPSDKSRSPVCFQLPPSQHPKGRITTKTCCTPATAAEEGTQTLQLQRAMNGRGASKPAGYPAFTSRRLTGDRAARATGDGS